jgi:hypothetical protein
MKTYERIPIDVIVSGLIDKSENLCDIWLGGGYENEKEGCWRCANIHGHPARNTGSFSMCLKGKYRGRGYDFSEQLNANNKSVSWLDIIAANIVPDDVRDTPMIAARKWAIQYLSLGGADWVSAKKREIESGPGAEERAAQAAAEAAKKLRWCHEMWGQGIDFDNREVDGRGNRRRLTPVEKYLHGRGITLGLTSGLLRCHPRLPHWEGGKVVGHWPAMLAPVVDVKGELIGLHRTWVLEDGSGKAPVDRPKMMLGSVGGGGVRLVDDEDVRGILGIAEGIETALSVMQMYGLPMWAALSADGMLKLELPDYVTEPVLFPDNDPPQRDPHTGKLRRGLDGGPVKVGLNAARNAADRYRDEGRSPQLIEVAESGCKDHNEVLVLQKEQCKPGIGQMSLAAAG